MAKTIKTARRMLKLALAPYVVCCDYGTFQPCWTRREAAGWIPFCHGGWIHERY